MIINLECKLHHGSIFSASIFKFCNNVYIIIQPILSPGQANKGILLNISVFISVCCNRNGALDMSRFQMSEYIDFPELHVEINLHFPDTRYTAFVVQ